MARLSPEQVAGRADRTALCLDYDGTLAPIVDDPEAAAPLPGTPELLGRLAGRFAAVALVSGRPAAWLAGRAAAPGVRYLGLYGLEEIVDGRVVVASEAEQVRPAVLAALRELRADPTVTAAGAYVEDKGLSVGVHLRRVADPGRWAGPIEAAARDAATRRGLRAEPGKLVWELRPAVDFDKGDAVRRVVAEASAEAVVMAGDDRGDLVAFRAVEELAASGLAALRIAVRSAESPPELLELADLTVQGPEGLRDLLERWAIPAS
jgi:trehalose 6-phosphate phosphatase